MFINRYENQNNFAVDYFFPLGLRIYQRPWTWGQFGQVPTKAIVPQTSSRCQHQFAPARHSMLAFINARFSSRSR